MEKNNDGIKKNTSSSNQNEEDVGQFTKKSRAPAKIFLYDVEISNNKCSLFVLLFPDIIYKSTFGWSIIYLKWTEWLKI